MLVSRTVVVVVLLCVGVFGLSGGPALCAAGQSPGSPIDLVQTIVSLPGKVKIQKKFYVLDEIEGVGEATAPQSVTFFYLSTDDKIDPLDIVVGSRRVGVMRPGATNNQRTELRLPATVKPGTYFMIARADAQNQIEERYKDNNTKATKFTVLPADPPK